MPAGPGSTPAGAQPGSGVTSTEERPGGPNTGGQVMQETVKWVTCYFSQVPHVLDVFECQDVTYVPAPAEAERDH